MTHLCFKELDSFLILLVMNDKVVDLFILPPLGLLVHTGFRLPNLSLSQF